MKMVITLTKIYICLYLYHYIQKMVTANIYSPHILNRQSRQSKLIKVDENDKHLIDTPGCTIPNIWAEYRTIEANDCKISCGERAVFIVRLNEGNLIKYIIDKELMKKLHGGDSYECCSQFGYRSDSDDDIEFTDCESFVHGTQMILEHEIITVTCKSEENSTDHYVYEDAYILVQKHVGDARQHDGNSWNVLLMGMDTMSRGRAIQSMPKLVKYFRDNDWLDYRAFQKAEDNTYPNLMITYTGIYNYELLSEECKNNTNVCNDLFIWSKFKSSGFITAYVEDALYHTFESTVKSQPTDHYIRSFFHLGMEPRGNIECLRTRPSAYHVLDYVYQFANEYKREKYFGAFWTSTYSHDPVHIPTLLQNQYIQLFKKLNSLGALSNTIIFFYGDHGVRYGPLKIPIASYYDERLPMLFMWFPHSFRNRFEGNYYNLQLNQHRLTTHSDLHSTLWNILKLSDENVVIIPPRYCPSCGSLLEEKPKHRRCEDMNVTARWCSCYVLNDVLSTDVADTAVPLLFVSRLWVDQETEFHWPKVLRHKWFRSQHDHKDNITYYVIAIEVTRDNKQFEAVYKRQQSHFFIEYPLNRISSTDQNYDNCSFIVTR